MARPRKELDMEALKRLCQIQCTQEEMAWFFGMSVDTIETRIKEQFDQSFSEFYKEHSAGGIISLRREQYKSAMRGNTTMLIWLGKQFLKQKENRYDFTVDTKDEKLVIQFGKDEDGKDQSGAV